MDTKVNEKVDEKTAVKESTITTTPSISQPKPCIDAYAEIVAKQAGFNNEYEFHNKHRTLPGYYEHYHAAGTPKHTHIWYLY